MQQPEVVELYNKGLQYIKTHDYERAKDLLKGIALIFHDKLLIQKVIGSLEMMTGYPYLALKYWEPLIDENIGVTEEQCVLLREQLPIYDELQDLYSKAMQWVIIGQLRDAELIMAEAFQKAATVPIPTEMFRAYLILLIQLNLGQKAYDLFKNAPQYVQLAPDLRILEVTAKKMALDEQNFQPMKDPWTPEEAAMLLRSDKKKKKIKGSALLGYNLAIAFLLLIVIIAFLSFGGKEMSTGISQSDLDELKSENENLRKKVNNLQGSTDKAYNQISTLEKENVQLNEQLAALTDDSDEPEQPETPTTPAKPETTETPTTPATPTTPTPTTPTTPTTPSTPTLPTTYTIQPGDNLNKISNKFYGTKANWKKICDANKAVVSPSGDDSCSVLTVGGKLTIPK